MENQWKKLAALHHSISIENYTSNTEKQYAKDLSLKYTNNNLKPFYRAIQALERGCGYPKNNEFVDLYRICANQNNHRFLQIIENNLYMLDTVMSLRYVDNQIKLSWLNAKEISAIHVLFECLRQLITSRVITEENQSSVVCGLYQLLEISVEQFQYLITQYMLYRPENIPLMTKLIAQLPEKGWAALSKCISFHHFEETSLEFWDKCGQEQNWSAIYSRAYPLLDEWNSYIDQSIITGKFGRSLYNCVSNFLINILYYKFDSVHAYLYEFEKIISTSEKSMHCWYEESSQQAAVLFASLAQIQLFYFVWQKRKNEYAISFPNDFCYRTLFLISQYRFLWDTLLLESSDHQEIWKLKEWLEHQS